ncbi:MAG: hypothetical protein HOY44_03525 [Maritimibacter sp.]|uniref:hypothetical protein n=1 Tax=Maritimibacter sp. TaxID=2003363 RepID=UPI001D252C12|nr:hypothetical protein [Maritimibacter sp.]MBL6426578.1 hypothetical protein [Maritimibacter sp.]
MPIVSLCGDEGIDLEIVGQADEVPTTFEVRDVPRHPKLGLVRILPLDGVEDLSCAAISRGWACSSTGLRCREAGKQLPDRETGSRSATLLLASAINA